MAPTPSLPAGSLLPLLPSSSSHPPRLGRSRHWAQPVLPGCSWIQAVFTCSEECQQLCPGTGQRLCADAGQPPCRATLPRPYLQSKCYSSAPSRPSAGRAELPLPSFPTHTKLRRLGGELPAPWSLNPSRAPALGQNQPVSHAILSSNPLERTGCPGVPTA